MQHIHLAYNLSEAKAQTGNLSNLMLTTLRAVSESGSILAASKALGLSYRHVWGEFKRWEKAVRKQTSTWVRLNTSGSRFHPLPNKSRSLRNSTR